MRLFDLNKQAWRVWLPSLLFILLAACTPAAEAASTWPSLPTAMLVSATATIAPSETPTIEPALPAGKLQIYTVVASDSVTSIAAQFGLQPETVLWANYDQLFDIPDFLMPGMQLTILPADGVYHQVGGGDTVENIAAFFAADADALMTWPSNNIDANNPVIFAGQWVFVPGGQRGQRNRTMPNLFASAMAVSPQEYGSGACPQNSSLAANADGIYAWPVSSHEIVAEDYWSAHPGVDLRVDVGEQVLAADDGVVTYSGWSNFGYGNVVMIDHGNGDFSLYAGLGSVSATCGKLVAEGEAIGLGGVTGHPAGPFVHFEIRRGGENINPLGVLPVD